MRILLIEDDKHVMQFVSKGLREESHAVICADRAETGLARLAAEKFDIIILDRILPDAVDGLSVVHGLRKAGNDTPILILSGLGEPSNKIAGLKAGGDDYLSKPFAFSELLARVEALARRGKAA